jgi:two-component system response regulator RegA
MSGELHRALIVDDDLDLQSSLARMLRRRGISDILVATGATGAIAYAESDVVIDVVLLDVHLGDGNGVDVCRAFSKRRPAPRIVAVSGLATAKEGFALARMGVRTFLQKPVSEHVLWDAITSTSGLDIAMAAISMVGTIPLRQAQASLRQAMIEEAFARAGGSITQAAYLLGVTRQAMRSALATLEAEIVASDDPIDDNEIH